jgi:hypothetical protein
VEVRAGDVLLVRTGFGALWADEAAYLRAAGVAKSGTLWAAGRGVAAVGADNMAWDVPGERDPESGATLFAHVYLLPQKGVYIIENVNLEELARDRRWVFAFVGIPLKFNGATGSPLRPLALYEAVQRQSPRAEPGGPPPGVGIGTSGEIAYGWSEGRVAPRRGEHGPAGGGPPSQKNDAGSGRPISSGVGCRTEDTQAPKA